MAKLNARKAETAKPGKYGDGGGLQLVVSQGSDGALNRKWVFRFLWQGRQRESALPDVSLAGARDKAAAARRLVREGVDPIADKQKKDHGVPTFGALADETFNDLSLPFAARCIERSGR